MLIDYTPGEECRIAVVEGDRLEEYHAERFDSVSRVGNIYLGRVANIEPAIQAAFVDFGVGAHGFLHVTDLHPRFFPDSGEDATERVGKKVPRRERPPIQQCLKRGQEIMVQVIKEGVGTKGPTLTSYISIPGRFLVMMPQMDRVGVSRKVEDDEKRRQMREILDALDLPDGFGFILRTAGFERTKAELKRDLAYLNRLWKDMERRRKAGRAPRPLYSESDLLVRTLRDALTGEIGEIIIDDEQALKRAGNFLRILTPRARPKLLHYGERTPVFQAYGVESQIANINSREVPLHSGGALVFDETEAVVAIDVNSGRSRKARDSETNAYRTNLEATDEICRQLRLRDLGGVVICDLIDMRDSKHRRAIEQRFRERLKRDRAKSTILPISAFGILEMTRQRMRGSHETVHFAECPTCHGRGVLQRPASVADDALRTLEAVLAPEKVARVEMVVSPRVASELLSSRRKSLSRLERVTGKHVDVRVSETMPVDRVVTYAYDDLGGDVSTADLAASRPPDDLKEWKVPSEEEVDWAVDLKQEAEHVAAQVEEPIAHDIELHPIELDDSDEGEGPSDDGEEPGGKKKRRRRRRRKKKAESSTPGAGNGDSDRTADGEEASPSEEREQAAPDATGEEERTGKKKKKRRRRRRKKSADGADAAPETPPHQPGEEGVKRDEAPASDPDDGESPGEAGPDGEDPGGAGAKKKRRRRRGGRRKKAAPQREGTLDEDPASSSGAPRAEARSDDEPAPASSTAPARARPEAPGNSEPASTETGAKKRPRRALYAASRRKLTPGEIRPEPTRED